MSKMSERCKGGRRRVLAGITCCRLPPGQFDIKATFLGYGPILVKSVKIEARKSTRLDVVLKETEVPLHEIVVSQVPSESTIIGALLAQRNTPGVSAVLARQGDRAFGGQHHP